MQKIFKLIIIVVGILPNLATSEDLVQLYTMAQDSDPTLLAAYAAHQAKLEELPKSRALLLPNIKAIATTSNNKSTADQNLTKYDLAQNSLQITQPIFNMANWTKISQANNIVKQAYATLTAAEQDLLFRVAQQYFAILGATDDLYFTKAEQKAFAKQLEQTQQRYKVGLIAITDVHVAQASHDAAYASVIGAENNLNNSKEKLREIVGKNITSFLKLKQTLKLDPPNPKDPEQWVSTATQNNWELQAARYMLEIARQKIHEQSAGHYPTVDLTGSANRYKYMPPTSPTTIKSVGIALNIPVFAGGGTLAATRQAHHQYAQSGENLEQTFRTTESNARQAYNGVLTQLSQITAFKQAVISSASALKATKAAFDVGNRTVVDVLNAQSQLINAQKNYAKARYEYILQRLTLKKVSGTLQLSDLQEINGWLEASS